MSKSLYTRLARQFKPERFAVSRRDVLKATLAASAGLLLSNCNDVGTGDQYSMAARRLKRKVVIVGAGFAGLACAYELASVGYDVVVLEARNRVGGRALSFHDMIRGKVVEGGGELIGSNHPTWVQYAKKFNLGFTEIPNYEELYSPVMLEGRVLGKDEAVKLLEEMDKAFESITAAAAGINEDEPWTSPNAAALDAKSMRDWLEGVEISPLAKRAIRAELEANESVALERQSYLAFLTMVKGGGLEKYWTESETCRCTQGNQALAIKLAEALPFRVKLNAPVKSIAYGGSGVMVTTMATERFQADDVVLAVPPSVWKSMNLTPALPTPLTVQMGTAVKYLSAMKRRYWLDAKLAPDSESDGDVSMTWEGTEGQKGDGGVDLTCFSGGPAAERIRARPPADRRAAYENHLEKVYPGYRENFAGTARFMDWPAEQYTQAAYSFAAPGQITSAGPILYKGIDRLHFAGEHTCFKFPGYMEGGLNSGVSLARRIAKRDNVV
jgi:monoamine oxidase